MSIVEFKAKKKVILFNGAPNSGKDESARIMQQLLDEGSVVSFKTELYKLTAKHFGMNLSKFIKIAQDRNTKELKTKELINNSGLSFLQKLKLYVIGLFKMVGMSPREAMIFVSEEIVKPKFGSKFFGHKIVETMSEIDSNFFFVPDSGFVSELQPLVDAGYDVHVVRIKRDGCSFDNDSRIELTDELLKPFGIKGIDVDNNGTLDELSDKLLVITVDKIIR